MTATITPFPLPSRLPDPAIQGALAELLQLGLAVARVASHLAEAEDRAVAALAEAAAHTTLAALAPSASLGAALQAGRDADASDAARDAIAARVASITESFGKAARAVRRTAALQARLAEARPFHHPPSQDREPPHRPADMTTRSPASDADRADRPDTPEWGDELAGQTDEEVLHGIRRDLAGAVAVMPPSTVPEARPASGQRPGVLVPRSDPSPGTSSQEGPPSRPDPLPRPDT